MANIDICPFCEKIVKTRDKAICCDLCSKWIHIKFNNLNDLEYEYLKSNDESEKNLNQFLLKLFYPTKAT